MSLKKSQPLRLVINESKRLNQLMVFIHSLALIASMISSLPISLKGVLLIAISGHFYIKCRTAKRYRIEYSETGWKIAEGEEFTTIEILPSTVVSTIAIFLHFKTDSKPNDTRVIFNDALAESDYRSLIAKLKTTLT